MLYHIICYRPITEYMCCDIFIYMTYAKLHVDHVQVLRGRVKEILGTTNHTLVLCRLQMPFSDESVQLTIEYSNPYTPGCLAAL
jgi:hypothetical protein